MNWTLRHRLMWFWCWLCYRAYTALPAPNDLKSRFGRFDMWLLGYAGAYAHSDRADFHLCRFFYRSAEECDAAWDLHIASRLPSTLRECE